MTRKEIVEECKRLKRALKTMRAGKRKTDTERYLHRLQRRLLYDETLV